MLFLMLLGIALWIAAHVYKRCLPDHRAALGDKGKAYVAIAILLSIILMVVGYSNANYSVAYHIPGGRHLAALLMFPAIAFLGLGQSKSRLLPEMRHPMLTGFAIWCGAHLLANGDTLSIVLFGALGIWSIAQMWLVNQGTNWAPVERKPGSKEGDVRLAIITLVIYVIIVLLHMWLGPNPFTGR